MAIITPNTDLYLLKVPLEINDINQLNFSSTSAQYNYFNSLPKVTVDDFTYQRKDGKIRFPMQMDEIITYNYCMYRNTEYSDKWFYAFITNMEYVNDNMTLITIKTDTWQTWQFSLRYKPCLIEREHTNDDTIGSNTLPEGLELGDIVANGETKNFGLLSEQAYMVVADVTMIDNQGTNQTLAYSYDGTPPSPYANGIPSGCYHILISRGSFLLTGVEHFVNIYNKAGLAEAIQNIYVLPANIVSNSAIHSGLTISTTGAATPDSMSGLSFISSQLVQPTVMVTNANYRRPTTLNGYTPRNRKLYTYPFSYINVSNNAGTTIPFRYEDFKGTGAYAGSANFEVEGTFCPSGSVKAIPKDYKNLSYENGDNRYDYALTGAKYPICSWVTDSYTNWLTQNAVNMSVEWRQTLISAGADLVGGAIGGGVAGGAIGGIAGGKNLIGLAREQMLAKTQANLVPDQAHGNINSGDIVFSKLGSAFTFMPMSIKAEYAKCIDDYLSMFGYATNRVKIPNINGRRNWNYVKTVGCYIEGDIPQDDLAEIKGMFDSGITIWHNPATFADYSQNNDII